MFGTGPVGQDGLVDVLHAVLNNVFFICAGVSEGWSSKRSAIEPATTGVAIDVPLQLA